MSAYSSLNLKTDVAARAREIAFARGIPLASLFSSLIDRAYAETFGADALKNIEVSGDKVLIKLRGTEPQVHLTASRAKALDLAETLKKLATGATSTSGHLDLDSPYLISIMRKGRGVIIEATMPDNRPVKKTMSLADANSLADEIKTALN